MDETRTAATSVPGPPKLERPVRRTTGITRVGMDPGAFKRSVLDHLLYTCARELREASARRPLPGVGAHRARPAGAPLAGHPAHVRGARRQARLLPVVRVPDRPQPGPVPAQPGPVRDGRGAGRRARLRPRAACSSRRATPAWATAAWGGWPPASWTRWPRWSCPRSATASATTSASSSSASRTATRSSCTTTGCESATPGSCRAMEDAQTVRLGGRTEMRHDPDGRLRVDWVDGAHDPRRALRLVHRRPQDRHREHAAPVGGARHARLRPAALQRRRLPARGRGEDRLREHLQGALPERPDRRGQGAAAQAAVLLRRLLDRRHRAPLQAAPPRLRPVPQARRHPAQRHAPGDRRRRADARPGRRGGARLGRGLGASPSRPSATPTTR